MNFEKEMLYLHEMQLETLQKIHFWVKFWSILAIIAAIISVIGFLIMPLFFAAGLVLQP